MSESEGLGFIQPTQQNWQYTVDSWDSEQQAGEQCETAQQDNGMQWNEMSGGMEPQTFEAPPLPDDAIPEMSGNAPFGEFQPNMENNDVTQASGNMDPEVSTYQPQTTAQPSGGPQPNQKKAKKRKKKPTQHPDEIVFYKGMTTKTIPSLARRLKDVTECVVGLQYVWEYRSPSKSFPPHYVCKLCAFARFQNDIIPHVKGWKHIYKYMRKVHGDKVSFGEDQASKDPTVRQVLKVAAAEVEKSEGRGQIKVIMKEPCEVPAFKELRAGMNNKLPSPPPLQVPQHASRFPKPNNGPFRDFGGPPQRPGYSRHGGYGYSNDYNMGNQQDPNVLLSYLDTFQIENEGDAQIVLKVTQKLTDMLMEYRLRSMPRDLNNHSMNSGGGFYSSPRVNTNKFTGPLASQGGHSRY